MATEQIFDDDEAYGETITSFGSSRSSGSSDSAPSASQKTFDVTRHDQPLTVPIGSILEIWDKSRLAFATYEGKNPGKASVRVRIVESGQVVSLDVG